jgi:hypothetical protein
MATDIRREGLNNQKRGICVMVSDLLADADIASTGSTIATLPAQSVIIAARVMTTVVTASGGVALDYNGSAIEAAIVCTALGPLAGTVIGTAAYSATGGDIVVKDGGTAPGDTAWEGYIIIEYIELGKVTGEYTDA